MRDYIKRSGVITERDNLLSEIVETMEEIMHDATV